MLYKYCPECYSLNLNYKKETKKYICNVCGYSGNIKEDSIDKINSLRKRFLISQKSDVETGFTTKKEKDESKDLISVNDKIIKKFGSNSKNNDWELL
ncbi:MAG: hypothetical protein PHR26_03725 [Candidatus ainarchaeum sp.]|nr:hypothetical protein [Candidatus ainarchaeum sp.]MDD3976211.1 hypothetical protein [Candidatus ainarchaeum sp.]